MPAKPTRTGRPGALEEARELVALVSGLSEAGDALSADGVSARLGVSRERAETLMRLVLESRIVGDTGLPLTEEEDEITLIASGGVRGRRLRLSRGETLAVAAALQRLGVPRDNPLRARLEASLSTEALDEDLASRLSAATAPGAPGTTETLATCAQAIAERANLAFSYRKAGAASTERRRVDPRALRHDDGAWYLDAYDLDRQGGRTFRVDRMEEALLVRRAPAEKVERPATQARTVRITFSDPSRLDVLPWHDLRIVSCDSHGCVVAETPYYGGSWLPRMLCACGGTATTDDAELTAAVQELARALLASSSSSDFTE